jgi:hypothetical protein
MKEKRMLKFVSAIPLLTIFLSQLSFGQSETCCTKRIACLEPQNPEGQDFNVGRGMAGSVSWGITTDSYCIANCPVKIAANVDEYYELWKLDDEAKDQMTDYILAGSIEVDNITGTVEINDGDRTGNILIGDFTFTLKLVDYHHDYVLKEDVVSWSGEIEGYMGRENGVPYNLIRDLSVSFQPYCNKIYDWERIPETCKAEVEDNEIEGGETTTIRISDIVDNQGRPSNYFERIIVEVNTGKINNGFNKHPLYIFEVGQEGEIDAIFEAPQKCDNYTETIKIHNSCEWTGSLYATLPEKEIATVEIKINDRLPKSCEVVPQKEEVEAGEFITIDIKNIVDEKAEPVSPEERIIVIAEKGEITNGDKSPGYSVFEVGDGTVTANYRAPDDCGITSDNIAVYGTCETDDEPREIYHDKLIGETDIDIKCDWQWSGRMTIEKLERFDCELEKGKEGFSKSDNFHELSTLRASISIQAENIDDSPPGFNIEMGENLVVSGFMKCELDNSEEHHFEDYDNPRTSYWQETLKGEDLINLNSDNLNLNFMASMKGLEENGSLSELEKMFESGDVDMSNVEDFNKKLQEVLGQGQSEESRLTVMVQLFGDCMDETTINHSAWEVENGERTDTSYSQTMSITIGGGLALEFEADYIRNEDGGATITGNYSNTTPITDGIKEGCPPKTETTTCTLNLSKRPKK